MVDKTDDKTEIDPDTLSDEDFMKLDVPPAEVVDPNDKGDGDAGNSDDDAEAAARAAAEAAAGGDAGKGTDSATGEGGEAGEGADGKGGDEGGDGSGGTDGGEETLTDEEIAAADKAKSSMVPSDEEKRVAAEKLEAEKAAAAEADKTKGPNDGKETLTLKNADGTPKDKEPTDEEKAATEAAKVVETQAAATSFFEKVSAPFKADGKEVQVRTPEEVIRLMQMGVNYSRRMEQMKPLREMDAMLTTHGLNTPEKLNELIDLSKGSKEAVQKFLKKHSIDPLDLDPSKADAHKTPNYRSDPKDTAFQDAIDNTLLAEGGKELLGDVNKDWDDESKEALRENPSIFGKLLEQRDTGVYEQINKELLHQRTMGYLANVPFLQAYEQVGNAMQKAGVFDKKEEPQKKTGLAPIDSGSRKAAKKTEQPNPNLSSAQKTAKAAAAAPTEPDYLSMDDDAFMKLAQPV